MTKRWIERYTAVDISFPRNARDEPDRCLYSSNATGTRQLYAWDRGADSHLQLTDRTDGTMFGRISPDGTWVWWFEDSGGDEHGGWMRQRFDAGPGSAESAVPGLSTGYPAGLALGREAAAVGVSTSDGAALYLHRYATAGSRTTASTTKVYASRRHATVGSLSYDETLLAFEHSEHGDAEHPDVRVLEVRDGDDAACVGELSDGPGLGVRVVEFAPCAGDKRLLVRHERSGRSSPLVWDVGSGVRSEPQLDLPGEVSASWYPDGRALLVRHHWHGRDELFCYDLESGALTRLDTPAGSIDGAAVRPDGTLEYALSSGAHPTVLLDSSGRSFLTSPRPAPPSVPLEDAWVDGPGGAIHALVAKPSGAGPHPCVFLLHGGPGGQVADGFWPARSALVDAGYAVVHVNYRGSSGYGVVWMDADRPAPGLIELEDVAAVQDWAVATGVADPARCVIAGISWGGYLTLLGLGTQPDRWAAGIGDVPIGDMVALYEDEMEPVREFDRSLFGGTPEELPEKWARSSPLTFADKVRAPLLVFASRNDARCPIRQVENFLTRLDEYGIGYESSVVDGGHVSVVNEEGIRKMRLQLDFLARHVPADSSDA